jgi:hypothetical protein
VGANRHDRVTACYDSAPDAPPAPSISVPTCDPRHGMSPASGVRWSGRGRSRSTMGSASWRHERNAEYEVQLREHCRWPVFDRSVSPPRKIGTVLQLFGSVVEHETFLDHQGGPSPCHCDGEKTHTSSFDHAYRSDGVHRCGSRGVTRKHPTPLPPSPRR